MKFTQEATEKTPIHRSIDFSELVNDKEMFVASYGGGNSVYLTLTEKQMKELRRHLTAQIRKIKK